MNKATIFASNVSTTFKILLLIPFLLFPFFLYIHKAIAFNMTNGNFSVEGNVSNPTDEDLENNAKNSQYKAPVKTNTLSGSNYIIQTGLRDQYAGPSLSFSISPTLIDFGGLTATNPVTRTETLNVFNEDNSYQVFAYEDSELKSPGGNAIIPDTSCDNGSCDNITGAPWTSSYTYGFGYHCDNAQAQGCVNGFSKGNYKQFADLALKQNEALIMQGTPALKSIESQITYKVTVSGTQQPGSYSNNITYLLIPAY